MKGFLDNLFDGDKKKKNTAGGGPKNPFANLAGPRKFQGTGQSLGGSNPGQFIPVELKEEGTLGLRIEKRPNSEGTAIISMVVEGTQAEAAGLQRGDILCYAGSEGKSEIMYNDFLAMAQSGQRPVCFEVRRIKTKTTGSNNNNNVTTTAGEKQTKQSAEAFNRRQAVIAAAEAREKAHKAKSKPVPKGEKKMPVILSAAEKRQQELEREREAQLRQQEVPKSEEARKAMEAAKRNEAALANQLGYNPYETNKMGAGQARNATVTKQHGAVGSGGGGNATSSQEQQSLPNVRAPSDPTSPVDDSAKADQAEKDAMLLSQSPEFEEAYTTIVTTNTNEAVIKAFGIMRTLVRNATTKGQEEGEAGAKFRRVRLANAKIKTAIVDVNGALDLMMAFGFQLTEEDAESYLAYPFGSKGPDFLPAALRQMEKYEKS